MQDLQDHQLDATKEQNQPKNKDKKPVTIQQSKNNKQKPEQARSPTATNQDRPAGQTKNKDLNTQHIQKQQLKKIQEDGEPPDLILH